MTSALSFGKDALVIMRQRPGGRTGVFVPSLCDWGNYTYNNWPSAACYPFDPAAWINRPLPLNPAIASYSATVIAYLKATYNNTVEHYGVEPLGVTYNDYAHPAYFAKASDPVYTLASTLGYGATTALNGQTLHAPEGMIAGGGGDAHVIVFDQVSGKFWDFWHLNAASGGINDVAHTLGAYAVGFADIFGDAIINNGVNGNGANASNTALYAGQIRGYELQAGIIKHPLSCNFVNCSTGLGSVPAHVYPATGNGRQSNAADPAMGQFFQYTGPIESLSVPEWKKVVLRCCRDYGFYMDDTGADGNIWQFRIESSKGYHAIGAENPAATFAAANLDGTHITVSGGVYYLEFGVGVNFIDNVQVIDPSVIQNPH